MKGIKILQNIKKSKCENMVVSDIKKYLIFKEENNKRRQFEYQRYKNLSHHGKQRLIDYKKYY